MEDKRAPGPDFIRRIVTSDVAAGKHDGRVQTRFPPEPNGYLHIGHAKAICINFGIAAEFGGGCHLRFDDTNPVKEDIEYVEAIQRDVRWLGFDWADRLAYASDYFPRLYEFAVELIRQGQAYVDHQSADEIRLSRGTLTEAGTDSPYRNRSVDENLELFAAMNRGEFEEGECVLRARIDMASPNVNLRDPVLYRIRKVSHQRTGDRWCIYPMYDFAHTLSDALEGTTHSLCSLEFEDHRPLYEWFLKHLPVPHEPQQIEFSRFNLMFTVMSKRKLKQLVDEAHVEGWDDPRMPTIAAFRRRGYTPDSIRDFIGRIGVTKKDNVIELGLLENCIREDLNERAPRRLAVLAPLKLVIENYPEDAEEWLEAANHPNRPELGVRKVPFSREILIERDDFMEDPPRKFFRLKPGGEVRLRYAYIIKCERVVKDENGDITEIRCSYDPATRSGSASAPARKVKGTIHWVSKRHAVAAEVRLYDRLFTVPYPGSSTGLGAELNPLSLETLGKAMLEPSLADAKAGERFQFERQGYFFVEDDRAGEARLVFNRTVTLRDSWAKVERQALAGQRGG
ncbi:glutamine--tRNA ligase/YqeY domain fusion protein [Candidatus Rariloculus sp.]|uniref:glutamine--tRNA ligase/YqeY domain fusion protein n=1 Tax=Candidatus Rariloculus sp. TaxID=3101265 RepID=UPI003D0E4217